MVSPAEAAQPSQAEIIAGYQKSGSQNPVKKTDIQKAYKPYGLKLGAAKKGASDTQLYAKAQSTVVNWFRQQKLAAAKEARVGKAASAAAWGPKQVQGDLAYAGMAGASPPPYATISQASLQAWIRRAVAGQATAAYVSSQPSASGAPAVGPAPASAPSNPSPASTRSGVQQFPR